MENWLSEGLSVGFECYFVCRRSRFRFVDVHAVVEEPIKRFRRCRSRLS